MLSSGAACKSQCWRLRKVQFSRSSVSVHHRSVKMCSTLRLLVLISIIGNYVSASSSCNAVLFLCVSLNCTVLLVKNAFNQTYLINLLFCRMCWTDHSHDVAEIYQCYSGWKCTTPMYVCDCWSDHRPYHPVGLCFIILHVATAGRHTLLLRSELCTT